MASTDNQPMDYTLLLRQTDVNPTPPDVKKLEGLITITAEWEEERLFFGPRRRQHTETWNVTADSSTYDIVANLLPESQTRANGMPSEKSESDSLPHYFTVHTESGFGGILNGVKVIRWSEANLLPWNESTQVPGNMNITPGIELEPKHDNIHLALGLMQTMFTCTYGTRFSRILFPCYKQYKRVGTAWQWFRGDWMNGSTENWWDADKAVADAREALYTQIWQGNVVWRVQSSKEMIIPLQLHNSHLEESPS